MCKHPMKRKWGPERTIQQPNCILGGNRQYIAGGMGQCSGPKMTSRNSDPIPGLPIATSPGNIQEIKRSDDINFRMPVLSRAKPCCLKKEEENQPFCLKAETATISIFIVYVCASKNWNLTVHIV